MTLKEMSLFALVAFSKVAAIAIVFGLTFRFNPLLYFMTVADFFFTFGMFFLLRLAMLYAYNVIKARKEFRESVQNVLVYGIGRMCHIAFWEPTFAADYADEAEWKAAPYRIAAKIHPLTVEQNALTSFKSRTTLVPCRANTIGPGLFLQADYAIGGADGVLGRGMGWQGMSFLTTLHYGPDTHIVLFE